MLFPNSGNVTTLLQMAREQAERVGRRIRERRQELGLTQRELADLIPSPTVTSDYISKWERGENKPSDEHMALLATALQTTDVDLLAGPIAEREPSGETPDLAAALDGTGLSDLRAQLDRIETMLATVIDALGLEEHADVHPLEQINQIAAALPELLATDDETAATTETQPASS